MTGAGGMGEQWPNRASFSSVTVASESTSSRSSKMRWGREQTGKCANASRDRYSSYVSCRYGIWWWRTARQPWMCGSSRHGEAWRMEWPVVYITIHCICTFLLSAGTNSIRWELRHLSGSPRCGGGIRACQTLARVNTVWIHNNNNSILHAFTQTILPQQFNLTVIFSSVPARFHLLVL